MKNLKADIVVVGAGTAGLPAAITAAEKGASVILLEKRGTTGGTANRANMVFAVESRLQRQSSPFLSKEKAFRDHMDWTHWRVDSRLVKAFYDKSASTIDWLEGMGLEFEIRELTAGGYNTPHIVKAPQTSSAENVNITMGTCAHMIHILTERAKELGVQIYLRTPVRKLIKKGRRVTGVLAEDVSKEEIRISAGAVIICTGGFSDNSGMIKEFCGYEQGKDLFIIKVLGLKGDGIRIAWEAGAAPSDMHLALMHHLPPPCQGPGGTAPELRAFSRPSNIMVNLQGQRFIPEDLGGGHQSVANAISQQKNRAAFMIFDSDIKKYYDAQDLSFVTSKGLERPLVFPHDNLDDNIRAVQEKGYKYLFIADSVEDLCAQTGIDLEGLKETLDEYNKACKSGRDELFNKSSEYLRPVKKSPFYAARFFPGAYGTVGGIRINHKTEALTNDYTPIPGLYAAGSDANAIYDTTYVPLAGNYMGFAVNTGRMAGENAVEFVNLITR